MTWGTGLHVVFLLAADSAPDAAPNGPIVVVLLAALGVLGTLGTALGPTFLEIVKNRGARRARPGPEPPSTSAPQPPGSGGSGPSGRDAAAGTPEPAAVAPVATPPASVQEHAVQSAFNGLSLVEQAVLDYRKQRDDAMRRYDQTLEELESARDVIRRQAVTIARYESSENDDRNSFNRGRHGMRDQNQGWGPST